jgi:osomolarity two-component system response regulator SKN7
MQMSELSRRAGGLSDGASSWDARADALARIEELHRERVGLGVWGASSASSAGAATSTAGQQQQQQQQHQQQQQQQQQQRRRTSMPEPMGPPPPPTSAAASSSSSSYSGWPPSSLPMSVSDGNGSGAVPEASSHEGLQVYTVGHLMPRDMDPAFSGKTGDGTWAFDAGGMSGAPQPRQRQQEEGDYMPALPTNGEEEVVRPSPQNPSSSSTTSASPSSSQRTLRVRRSTFVPGWAVPPRVLLVDDDAVTRTLSKKFLQVFGCTTDIAVDGVGAVTKMNLEKYDLVLMVGVFVSSVSSSPSWDRSLLPPRLLPLLPPVLSTADT